LPIITSSELSNYGYHSPNNNHHHQDSSASSNPTTSLFIHFYGRLPARTAFKLAWTELYQLPRNSDGSLATSRLNSECEFLCPGESGACIASRLVCNGIQNCPNITTTTTTTTTGTNNEGPHDESPELCKTHSPEQINWFAIGLGATGGAILAGICLGLSCRACRKRTDDDDVAVY